MPKNKFNSIIDYDNKNFIKILNFYLFNCPVKFKNNNLVSVRADTFEKLGLVGSNLTRLLNIIKKDISKDRFISLKKFKVNLKKEYDKIKKNFKDPDFEIVLFKCNDDLGVTKSLFYMIRNGLAHGSFNVKDKVYYFESIKNGDVKAIIRLKESTLLKWIDFVHTDISKLKKSA